MNGPALVVLSSLFPSGPRPTAGVFIRERMFRVGRELPITVVSPQPWFPGQGLIRLVKPGYRLAGAAFEEQQGVEVYRPRALCVPGFARHRDGLAMALAALPIVKRLRLEGRCDLIDAHFAYPDGYAASLLGKWLELPYTITMRGTEPKHLREPQLRRRIVEALKGAAKVFTVSNSLREVGIAAGVPATQFMVVGNGVDTSVFRPMQRDEARARLGIPQDAKVLITVGALVERKGFHRVIALLPQLRERFPNLLYLCVGGASPEGDWTGRLKKQVAELGLEDCVRFLGPIAPADLRLPLSASDVFTLPSSNEGWANVILEAMACGLPVVASDVGGNVEVVANGSLGSVYAFGDERALHSQLESALARDWSRDALLEYAAANAWEARVRQLLTAFESLARPGPRLNPGPGLTSRLTAPE
jgi:glycosyltransferase involved in cell wall biosynthesis